MKIDSCAATASRWTWDRVFQAWNARIASDQRASEALKSPFLELTWAPRAAALAPTILDWVPLSGLPELKADLATGGRAGYPGIPPFHWLSGSFRSRGAMQTVQALFDAKDSPEMVCAVLLQGSIHELIETSRSSRRVTENLSLTDASRGCRGLFIKSQREYSPGGIPAAQLFHTATT